ncbi:MAG: cytidylate kinase family protein [Nitrososphaeria archaeon]
MTDRNVVVAISGLHGVGKTSQAKRLANSFGLRHVSGGIIFRDLAKIKGASLVSLSNAAEESNEIDYLIDSRMVEEGRKGNVVIDAMLCAWFLRDIAHVKIFLSAPERVRIARIASRDGVSYQEAYNETLAREASEMNRFKRYYDLTIEDVKNSCDLILSTEGLDEDEVFSILKYYVQLRISKLRQ